MDDHAQGGSDRSEREQGAARAPYSRPALKVYGTIAALTRTIGKMGMVADGGMGSMSKTS